MFGVRGWKEVAHQGYGARVLYKQPKQHNVFTVS